MKDPISLLGRSAVAFNLMPSLTLHASRHAQHAPPGLAEQMQHLPDELQLVWHRHWSREILRRLGLEDRPVLDTSLPALRLALLTPQEMMTCALRIGSLLCGPRLRRAILGREVRMLIEGLGDDALRYARSDTARHYAGMVAGEHSSVDEVIVNARELGIAVFREALKDGPQELTLRAELKLPLVANVPSPITSGQACLLGLQVLR